MSEIRRVLIAGGGIGGLTLAIALERLGIPVLVFEQAPVLSEVGSGVTLWCNAVRVLDRLGLGEALRSVARSFETAERSSHTGRVLTSVDMRALTRHLEGANLFIHRARLQSVLLAALPPGRIVTGARCTGFDQTSDDVVAHFGGYPDISGDLLVGADGLRSAIRAQLWNDGPPTFCGETCWRAVLELPGFRTGNTLRQIFGTGLSAGICPLDGDRMYYRLNVPSREGEKDRFGSVRDDLLQRFRDWPYRISELIESTPDNAFVGSDIYDRTPIPTWSRGRVTLLGDAAHPTMPNMGQGACMAIEDAMVLARALAVHRRVTTALADYERERVQRTGGIVRSSRRFGRVDQWSHPTATRIRDFAYRTIAPTLGQRFLLKQLAYDAGHLPC